MLALCLAVAAPAHATFPGSNGKIAFSSWTPGVDHGCIYTINPDGSAAAPATSCDEASTNEWYPAWSADGRRLAYVLIDDDPNLVYLTDGADPVETGFSGQAMRGLSWSPDGTTLATFPEEFEDGTLTARLALVDVASGSFTRPVDAFWSDDVDWSPDGQKIAFDGVHTVAPDGSQLSFVTDGAMPSWSPNGARLVFVRGSDIWTSNADGTDPQQLTNSPTVQEASPVWSPDGTKIAFSSQRDAPQPCGPFHSAPCFDLHVMSADGTDETNITNTPTTDEFGASWQPIPINAYPRPKFASPMKVALVPASEPCTSPNRTHGPPLASGSCSPPQQSSGQLTVGTPDANGQGPNSVARVWLRVQAGIPSTPADEADIGLSGSITDVRVASDLSDYTGPLEARVTLRITDKDSTPHPGGPGAATTEDIPWSFPIPCAATAAVTIGAHCTFDTTAEAFVPGIAKEGRRAIWELGQLAVHDGSGGVFMRQGIFVP